MEGREAARLNRVERVRRRVACILYESVQSPSRILR